MVGIPRGAQRAQRVRQRRSSHDGALALLGPRIAHVAARQVGLESLHVCSHLLQLQLQLGGPLVLNLARDGSAHFLDRGCQGLVCLLEGADARVRRDLDLLHRGKQISEMTRCAPPKSW
jgi:hypothetical protein